MLGRVCAAIAPGTGGQLFVLHGLGGSGKTAVAHELFNRATEEFDRVGLWVNSSDDASLRAGMLAVAADRGAHEGELSAARSGLRAAADLVWDYLDRSPAPWFLVIDNADDPGILGNGWLRSSRRGTVLVTTRQAAESWWPGAELLHVGVLPREDAAQVLRDLAPGLGSVKDASDVADRLGRLPLALTLAGGFLSQQVLVPMTMAEYGVRLDVSTPDAIDLMDQGARRGVDPPRLLVSSTWQLSLKALVAQGLPESVTLMNLLACWAGDPLPLSVLQRASLDPGLANSRVDVALRGLLDHSLTDLVNGEQRCVRTHPVLLESVVRDIALEERDRLASAAAHLITAELPAIPERGAPDARFSLLAPHVLALLRRVADWPTVSEETVEEAIACALRLVIAQHRAGDYASALSLANNAVSLSDTRLGEGHVLTLRLRRRIGRGLYRVGSFQESEVLHRRVLADCERLLGPTSADTYESCLALSNPLLQLGKADEAAGLILRSVAGRVESLGPLHPLTLNARKFLLTLELGPELNDAISSGPQLLEDCRSALGARHPISLMAELDYAYALFRVGKYENALPHVQRALAAHEERYGSEYPITLNARSTLSRTLAALGEKEQAVEHLKAVIRGRIRVLGEEHPWTTVVKQRLEEYENS
ncbi:tetratricopeptide repeat protein [Streptomyces ovatisporus]|uniref:Tetratricopeptide repeat protein n=1 Tax=Streptomyces ovatisporus TaxID=1128682 RepID=A0ABV9A724_9ACTN